MPFMRNNGGIMVASSIGLSMHNPSVTMAFNLGSMTPNYVVSSGPPPSNNFFNGAKYLAQLPTTEIIFSRYVNWNNYN